MKDKYYTKKYGRYGIRIWKDTKDAKADAAFMRRQCYKVKMTPDNKSVIILGKTIRGYQRKSMIPRSLRKKPYTPTGYPTFRQPSLTLRKLGWEAQLMSQYLYAGMKNGEPIFIISASNIDDATIKLKKFKQVRKIEKVKKIGKTTKLGRKGKMISLQHNISSEVMMKWKNFI